MSAPRKPTVAEVSKLRKMLGSKYGWQINPRAPDEAAKTTLREKQKEMIAAHTAAKEAADARRALLLSDPLYVELIGAERAAYKARSEGSGVLCGYPITVGVANDIFFSVRAQADSWDAIFDILEKKGNAL